MMMMKPLLFLLILSLFFPSGAIAVNVERDSSEITILEAPIVFYRNLAITFECEHGSPVWEVLTPTEQDEMTVYVAQGFNYVSSARHTLQDVIWDVDNDDHQQEGDDGTMAHLKARMKVIRDGQGPKKPPGWKQEFRALWGLQVEYYMKTGNLAAFHNVENCRITAAIIVD